MSENNLSSFEKWLSNIKLPADKKQFLETNKELFDIVFEAGKQEAKDERTFKSIAVFHDIVVDTLDLDLDNEQLERLFYCLPDWTQEAVEKYGFSDMADDIYTYLEKNGIPEGYKP